MIRSDAGNGWIYPLPHVESRSFSVKVHSSLEIDSAKFTELDAQSQELGRLIANSRVAERSVRDGCHLNADASTKWISLIPYHAFVKDNAKPIHFFFRLSLISIATRTSQVTLPPDSSVDESPTEPFVFCRRQAETL